MSFKILFEELRLCLVELELVGDDSLLELGKVLILLRFFLLGNLIYLFEVRTCFLFHQLLIKGFCGMFRRHL